MGSLQEYLIYRDADHLTVTQDAFWETVCGV